MVQQHDPWRADDMNGAADGLDWTAKAKEKPLGNFYDDYNALCRLFDVPAHPCLLKRRPPAEQGKATATPTTKLSLNLRNFEVDKTTVRLVMEALARSSDVDTLNFHNAGLADASMAILAECLPQTSVRCLSLDYNNTPPPPSPPTPQVAPTKTGSTEEEEAGDDAVSTCSASSSLRNFVDFVREGSKVKALSLRGNGIGDDEAVALARVVEGNTVLCSLNLFGNAITDVGAIAFAESLKLNSTLRGLSLARNLLSAASAESFGRLLAGGYEVLPSELDGRLAAETKIAAQNKIAQDAMKKKKDAQVEIRLPLGTLTKTEDGRTITGGSRSLATLNLGDNQELGSGGAISSLLLRLAESRMLEGGGAGSGVGAVVLQELHLTRCQGYEEQEEGEEGEQAALVAATVLGLRPTKVFV